MGQKTAPSSFTTKSLAPKTLPGTQQEFSKNFFPQMGKCCLPKNKTALLFFDTDNYKKLA